MKVTRRDKNKLRRWGEKKETAAGNIGLGDNGEINKGAKGSVNRHERKKRKGLKMLREVMISTQDMVGDKVEREMFFSALSFHVFHSFLITVVYFLMLPFSLVFMSAIPVFIY